MASQTVFLHSVKYRFHRLHGQLTGVFGMVLEEVEIIHILNQTHAIHRALTSLEALLLEQHLHKVAPHRLIHDHPRTVKELIAVFKRKIL